MTRVLLVNPRYPEDDIVKRRFIPPIELGYIASLAMKDGHEVKFIDANAENLTAEELTPVINEFKPNAVLTVTSSLDRWICPHLKIEESFKILETAKAINDEIRTALIGPHGTTSPDEMLQRSKAVDAVVRGEPEWVSRDWINAVSKSSSLESISGLSYRENGEIKHSPERPYMEDLDALPLPAYELFPMQKYHYRDHCLERPFAIALASRGCPYKCTFCLTIMQGKQWRLRSIPKIADELEWLVKEHGIRSVMFFDFEFGLNRDRTIELCTEVQSRNLPLTWGCEMRVSDAKEDVLRAMKAAGCNFIGFGVESGNQEILNKTKKGITLEQVKKAFALAQELEINVEKPYWILGLPGENMETIEKTIEFSLDLHSNSKFPGNSAFAVPYIGTEIHEIAKKNGNAVQGTWQEVNELIGKIDNTLPEGDLKRGPFYRKIKHLYYKKKYGSHYYLNPSFYRDNLHGLKTILIHPGKIVQFFREAR
jgi:radical SAM superfamily enzyme YgiQ (UPF0313 family)